MNSTLIWIIAGAAVIIAVIVVIARRKMASGPPIPEALQKGRPLPDFSAVDEEGNPVSSSDLLGKPAVLLFVRGNWCPFCTRQVEQLTGHYKEIIALGAVLIFVTPKPLETTKRVAEFFKVEFDYWLDDSLAIAKSLGLVLPAGVPNDSADEYGVDTVWPTAIITDAQGIIHYSRLSRLLFDRPSPETLLAEIKKL